MPQTFDDIDRLLARLKQEARELPEAGSEASTVQAVPMFRHQRLIDALKAARECRGLPLVDSRHPLFVELLAMDHDAETFIRHLYRRLLGREPDPEGLTNYLRRLPRVGRAFTVASMLVSDESRRFREQAGIRVDVPAGLMAPVQRLHRTGKAGKVLLLPLMGICRLWEIARRSRLRLEARSLRMEARLHQLYGQMTTVLGDVDGQLGRLDHFLGEQQSAAREVQRLRDEQAALWSSIQHQRRAYERTLELPLVERGSIEPADVHQDLLDAYYVAFEDACRGSEAQIRTHLRHYLVQLDQARQAGTAAIDLGCGRGEWLSLLVKEGFQPTGIDLNIAMIEHCREAGFECHHQDAVSALRQVPDSSQAVISGFHIAEHLPFDVLYALIDQAHRALAPGGVLILETPNPENLLVGSHTFYHDPTHLNPLTPTSMTFLLTYHGFGDVQVRRFNPYPEQARVPGDDPLTERVNGHLCGPQDFAIIGTKVADRSEEAA